MRYRVLFWIDPQIMLKRKNVRGWRFSVRHHANCQSGRRKTRPTLHLPLWSAALALAREKLDKGSIELAIVAPKAYVEPSSKLFRSHFLQLFESMTVDDKVFYSRIENTWATSPALEWNLINNKWSWSNWRTIVCPRRLGFAWRHIHHTERSGCDGE